MHIKDGSVTIVNYLGETPTEGPVSRGIVQYQHGGIEVENPYFQLDSL